MPKQDSAGEQPQRRDPFAIIRQPIGNVRHHLAKRRPERAVTDFLHVFTSPGGDIFLPRLARWAERADRNSELLDLLITAEERIPGYLLLLATILEVAAKTDRLDAVRRRFAAHDASMVRYSNFDILARYAAIGNGLLRDLARLKYGSYELEAKTLLERAEAAAAHLYLAPGIADRLFEYSTQKHIPRREFETRVRIACCVDHVARDSTILSAHLGRPPLHSEPVSSLLDMDGMPSHLSGLKRAKGTLFVFLHAGFHDHVLCAYQFLMKDGWLLRNGPAGGQGLKRTIAVTDTRAAMFRAVRLIEDGGSILMAPDARIGKLKEAIRVFGVEFRMAPGAPFIAYETECDTIWISVHRKGERFAPRLMEGPKRLPGERFNAFNDRWLSFYGEQIETLLKGDPSDLPLGMWARFVQQLPPMEGGGAG